jgi:hypothetical protein
MRTIKWIGGNRGLPKQQNPMLSLLLILSPSLPVPWPFSPPPPPNSPSSSSIVEPQTPPLPPSSSSHPSVGPPSARPPDETLSEDSILDALLVRDYIGVSACRFCSNMLKLLAVSYLAGGVEMWGSSLPYGMCYIGSIH